MTFNILTLIILITVVVSIKAFNDRSFMERMMFIPYQSNTNQSFTRFLSHILIHADWGHLAFNMFSLYFLGKMLLNMRGGIYQIDNDILELDGGLIEKYGQVIGQLHFVAIYILGGLFATVIPFMRNKDNPNYRSLGASGAVSAIIFAAILWNPGVPLRIMFIPIDIPAYIFGPLYLLYEYYADKRGGTGIAHDAHIGGAVFGIIYILIINFDKGKEFLGYFF